MAYDDFIKDWIQYTDIYQKKIRLLHLWGRSLLKGRGCLFSILLLLLLIPVVYKLNCCLPQNLIASLVISWFYPVFSLNDELFRCHSTIVWMIITSIYGGEDSLSLLIFSKDTLPFIPRRCWLRRGYRRLHQATEPILFPAR